MRSTPHAHKTTSRALERSEMQIPTSKSKEGRPRTRQHPTAAKEKKNRETTMNHTTPHSREDNGNAGAQRQRRTREEHTRNQTFRSTKQLDEQGRRACRLAETAQDRQ